MPWSAKARKLLEEQYAPVGRAGRSGLAAAVDAIGMAANLPGSVPGAEALVGSSQASTGSSAGVSGTSGTSNGSASGSRPGLDLPALLNRFTARADSLEMYTEAYRRYCWEVTTLDDYRIAPFHILATEGKTWPGETHLWQMETIARYLTGPDPIFMATNHLLVDLLDEANVAAGTVWWEELTASGGEGMVVKPLDFITTAVVKNGRGPELIQPAVKCRGREYLRIIYGPEYTLENNLTRLKQRSLSRKRNLALNEFALGVEALERFVREEPLYRVHECVFGVLALESEPVDPRL
jgi:protein phosphatase